MQQVKYLNEKKQKHNPFVAANQRYSMSSLLIAWQLLGQDSSAKDEGMEEFSGNEEFEYDSADDEIPAEDEAYVDYYYNEEGEEEMQEEDQAHCFKKRQLISEKSEEVTEFQQFEEPSQEKRLLRRHFHNPDEELRGLDNIYDGTANASDIVKK